MLPEKKPEKTLPKSGIHAKLISFFDNGPTVQGPCSIAGPYGVGAGFNVQRTFALGLRIKSKGRQNYGTQNYSAF